MPSLWLELTPRCDLACTFCYNPWREGGWTVRPSVLPFPVLRQQLGRLMARARFDFVALSGGEPLLYDELISLVQWVRQRSLTSLLTTNGRLFTRERADELRSAGLDGVQVSVLGATAETHDRLAGRACWADAIRALALGLEMGFCPAASCVVTQGNVSEVMALISTLARIGVRRVILNTVQPAGSALRRLDQLAVPEDAELDRAWRDTCRRAGMELVLVRPRARATASGAAEWPRLVLGSDGALRLCNVSSTSIGNILEMGDEDLDALIADVCRGNVEKYRDRVEGCACIQALARPAADAPTRPRPLSPVSGWP